LGYIQHYLTNRITDILVRIGPIELKYVAYAFAKMKQFLIPSLGTLSSSIAIPTVTDNAFSQGSIPEHMFGISFEPPAQQSTQNGELTWGQ